MVGEVSFDYNWASFIPLALFVIGGILLLFCLIVKIFRVINGKGGKPKENNKPQEDMKKRGLERSIKLNKMMNEINRQELERKYPKEKDGKKETEDRGGFKRI